MNVIQKFLDLPFKQHIYVGLLIRFAFIVYGNIHDRYAEVPYTDVDYKVFTDAARHVVSGNSPYLRDTYRYSPVIAYLLIPNILIGKEFGKFLFSAFDIFLAIAVNILIERQYDTAKYASQTAKYCALTWLYNPLSIAISTRGNADSFSCFVIILSIYFLLTGKNSIRNIVLAGFFLGIAIHLRLYPLAFSFPMYMSVGVFNISRSTPFQDAFVSLLPNKHQLILTFSCITTLIAITCGLYKQYGYEFLFETYLYHLFRTDTRHNFSILFYHLYLTKDQLVFDLVKFLSRGFQFVLLFLFSLYYGAFPRCLPLALFGQAVVLVAYNSVMTSQYFIWFLSLLPLVIHDFNISLYKGVCMIVLWIASQCGWLLFAYQLEFKSKEVFIWIWFQSVVFYASNIYILTQLLKSYCLGYAFGMNDSYKKK